MNIIPINDNNSRFDLVEIKSTNNCNPTPHCKIHGAMNCVAIHEKGKLWRCIQSKDLKDCRAGCEEVYSFIMPVREQVQTFKDDTLDCSQFVTAKKVMIEDNSVLKRLSE